MSISENLWKEDQPQKLVKIEIKDIFFKIKISQTMDLPKEKKVVKKVVKKAIKRYYISEEYVNVREDITSLIIPDISGEIEGVIPENVFKLTNLCELDLSDNFLCSIPDDIGKLTKLEILTLYNNNLDSLPDSIGNLVKLWELDLDDNNLETLPPNFGKLKNLRKLFLRNNNLKYFPCEFRNLENLGILRIGKSDDDNSQNPEEIPVLIDGDVVNVNFKEFMSGGLATKACKN